ncbi:hypothetical protein Chor_006411 [Crotalus horridus]
MAEESNSLVQQINKLFDENKDNKNEELFFTFKEVLYPNRLCSAETFEALETMEARKDDMLVIAYPKCGTNWVFQILTEMVAAISSNKELPLPRHHLLLEFGGPEKFLHLLVLFQKMKEQPSPRYYVTHLHYDNIPKSFLENKVKVGNQFHLAWNSYFDHALAWDKYMDEENIMIITYEELKENLLEGVKQIADFYQLPLSDEMIKSVADNATFQAMSSKYPEVMGQFASVIFRKGEVGDWRTLFTEAQSKEMDAKFEACLAGTKLGAKLKYDKYCKF